MRRFLHFFLSLSLMLLLLPPLMAQERTLTGKIISDDSKNPLSGVTVRVRGTQRVTQTDANGNFSIRVNPNETLEFSYVGYQAVSMKAGTGATMSISLKPGDNMMGEVVVTAMDIRRNPRELGYSVQKVDGNEIKESLRENFLNSLQGRVAGLSTNPTSGLAGASTQLVLRGFNSMTLDNQPLFVIDGVIADNSTVNQTSNGNSGLGLVENSTRSINETANRQGDYTNRIADINPNDIESVTVLKGPEATALYGSQASSGAIIITTKKGRNDGKINLNYDNAFKFARITRFPEVQTVYGNGFNGVNNLEFRYFGQKYAPGTKIYDNLEEFFQTAFTQTHNLSADFGKKSYSFRVSGSYLDQSGSIPENKYKRLNVRISNSTKVGKWLELTPAFSFIRSENDKPIRGVNGYMLNLLIWPANYDAKNWEREDGGKELVFASTQNGEIDNPYFSVNRNRAHDETNRYLSTLGVNVTPISWLTLSGRFGYDKWSTDGWSFNHPQSFILTRSQGGTQDNYYRDFTGYNHTLSATAKKTFGKWTARLMGGQMWQDYETTMYSVWGTNIVDSVNSAGQMMKDGAVITQEQLIKLMGDSSSTRVSSRQRLNRARLYGLPNVSQTRQVAYFGEAFLSWKNMIFATYSHRFETSSIFAKDYRKYDYPAASLSFILSDLFPGIKKTKLNYWKLRASRATTARVSPPYLNQLAFNVASSSGGGFSYGIDNNNPSLQPEVQKTYEVGTELRMFNSKLLADLTYYNTLCENQIFVQFRASYGTGFIVNTLNIGTTRNKGLEISLSAPLISKQNFVWDSKINFNKMWNKVEKLPPSVPEVYVSDVWPYLNARGGMVLGGPTTTITTFDYARNNNGDILIDPATGLPLNDGVFAVHGDRNPKFAVGWLNNMRYKNWKLNFLWDLKVGGDVFNATDQYLTINGKSKRTLDRETPRVIKGVLKDGKENSPTPTPNTIVVTPQYQSAYYGSVAMPDINFVEHDVNWFRMREITLSYTFPQTKMAIKQMKSLSVFLTGNDLILLTNYSGADPSVSANPAAVRGVGGWGFDYGNAGSPISFTFGVRAGF